MKCTVNWLRDYVDTRDLGPDELAERLTMLGLEVESVEPLGQGLDGLVVARIEQVRPHPHADRLVLCDVLAGGGEPVQVVCGAPNARAGLVSALAPPGTRLPGGMKIKKAKVRGEESLGMLCSERELGLSDDHGGIMELPADLEPGAPLIQALGLDDTVIEIDLTPNRPDCAGVIGIAREVAGFTGQDLRLPVAPEDLPPVAARSQGFQVEIQEPGLCPRYAGRVISAVRIAPSPLWLQQRLRGVGMRPINNVVDVTNLVMLEYGQPLHAFDADRLRGGRIVVRRPGPDERRFTTLDGVERELDADMLMICDGEGPVAVAGVMGGKDAEVSDQTTTVFLESACFDPVSIRGTARRLNLQSEAGYRFERGVDPESTALAMERAARLIAELAGGTLAPEMLDENPRPWKRLVLDLRVSRVCSLIGMDLEAERIASLLGGIGFVVEQAGEGLLRVEVPGFRVDIEREVDLIEEVTRLVGYNEVPLSMPRIPMDSQAPDPLMVLRRRAGRILAALDFCEAINYSFVAADHASRLGEDQEVLPLLNPLSRDQAVMRTSLLPGLLDNLRTNLSRQQQDIRLFETGKVFLPRQGEELPEERFRLAGVLCGSRPPGAPPLYFPARPVDFADVRGVVETLLEELRLEDLSVETEGDAPGYADAAAAGFVRAGERHAGCFGRLDPGVLERFGVECEAWFLDLDLEVLAACPEQVPCFRPLPRYPAVKRDIALVVPEETPAGAMTALILDPRWGLVESAQVFDIYRGKGIGRGVKSVAISIQYRSADKTLDDRTVDGLHQRIVDRLMQEFGGRYREE